MIKLKLCNGKHSCSNCVVHLICLACFYSFVITIQTIQGTTPNIHLLIPIKGTVSYLQEAQWSLNMITCAVKTGSQRNKPLLWLISFIGTAAFEIQWNSLKQSEPPTALGNDAQVGKWSAHRTNPPLTERKSHLNNTQTHSLSWSGWFTISRCRCWWANAEAGSRGDAGWSLSPARRN